MEDHDSTPQPRPASNRRDWVSTFTVAAGLLTLFLTVPLGRERTEWWLILIAVAAFATFVTALMATILRGANLARLLSLLLIVVTAFALGFYAIAMNMPGEFEGIETRIDALYFTLTTMTTTGYGDIHAEGQIARVLVSCAFVFDVVFLGLLGAELSRLAGRRRRAHEEAQS